MYFESDHGSRFSAAVAPYARASTEAQKVHRM
jgi:hypothetical protein